ncbi:hypothetical protein JCM4914_07730 [Streptomyces platensis subsp. malvinus]
MFFSGWALASVADLSRLPQFVVQAVTVLCVPAGPVAAPAIPAVPSTPAPVRTTTVAAVANRRISAPKGR